MTEKKIGNGKLREKALPSGAENGDTDRNSDTDGGKGVRRDPNERRGPRARMRRNDCRARHDDGVRCEAKRIGIGSQSFVLLLTTYLERKN